MAPPRRHCHWPDGRGEGLEPSLGSAALIRVAHDRLIEDSTAGSHLQSRQKKLQVAVERPSFRSSLGYASSSDSMRLEGSERKGHPDDSRIRDQTIRALRIG